MTGSFNRTLVLAVALLGTAVILPGPLWARPDQGELARRLDTMIEPYVALRDFSGVVLVAYEGQPLLARGFGMADFEHAVPNGPSTRFLVGSISQQFTAAAVLVLAAEGRLNVQDPVSRFLPQYPRGQEITLHQLLTHTSGVPDIYTLNEYSRSKHEDPELKDVVDWFRGQPLDFDPGEGYAYSNSGYVLLAHLIEVVSGRNYPDFLEDRIFTPLNMNDSGALRDRRIILNLAVGYDPLGQTDLRRAIQVAPALITGAGSIYSTAENLLRWDQALYTSTLLPDSLLNQMLTDHGSSYGYGVSVFERFGGTVIEHDGRLPGFAADLSRYVDTGWTVILLGNIQSAMRDRLRDDIGAFLHERDAPEREIRSGKSWSVESSVLSAVSGTYDFGPNFFVEVRAGHGRLFLRANQGEESEFFPSGPNEFFSRALYAGARFEFGENGRAVAMEYIREGRSFRGERR